MTDKEVTFLKSISEIDPLKYTNIRLEKLLAYTIYFLENNEIKPTLINLEIASYKLFKEKFFFSKEFSEYPHTHIIDRAIFFLRPKHENYATGDTKTSYKLTHKGNEVAKEVEIQLIQSVKVSTVIKIRPIDKRRESIQNTYEKFRNTSTFREYTGGEIPSFYIWDFYEVTPFTQEKKIISDLQNIIEFAKKNTDTLMVSFLNKILGEIQNGARD